MNSKAALARLVTNPPRETLWIESEADLGVICGPAHAMTNAPEIQSISAAEVDFETVFLEHFGRVAGLLTRMLGDRAQAEQVAGDVFWRLYSENRGLLLSGKIARWLYTTATRAGIDALRAAARRERYEQAAALDAQSIETGRQLEDLLRAERRKKVQSVLRAMKPAQAQVILLRAEGASYKELAEALGVAVSGVGTLLARAEAEFRRRYLQQNADKEEL
jgi:RNA polymerase sigma-70 factor, ECF subfamily